MGSKNTTLLYSKARYLTMPGFYFNIYFTHEMFPYKTLGSPNPIKIHHINLKATYKAWIDLNAECHDFEPPKDIHYVLDTPLALTF